MTVTVRDFLPTDDSITRAALTPVAREMVGSMILRIAGDVKRLQDSGRAVANFTVGDFAPAQFRIPDALTEEIARAVAEGQTNYPPADGLPELRSAISELYARELGLDYGPDAVCVGSGARPPIFASWQLFVEPGDRTVSFVPMWNVGYYAQLFQSRHDFVLTTAESNFFPTVQQARAAVKGARLVIVNSPLNPTGTVISPDVLRALAQALVEENAGRARPCMLLFDQVYWMLTAEGVQHANPVALVPECAPYVIQVDAISKCFAATGLRLGWGVLPPALQRSMKSLIGHIGAWAPKPEQLATARFLRQPGAMADYLDSMRSAVNQRLYALYDGVMALKAEGLPVDAVAPQGAIYLSFRVNLVGRKGFADNEAIRLFLLDKAGVGAVPFQAFDHQQDDGWFRLSVGAVGMDDIEGALARLQAALRDALPST